MMPVARIRMMIGGRALGGENTPHQWGDRRILGVPTGPKWCVTGLDRASIIEHAFGSKVGSVVGEQEPSSGSR
jgi:hypothetical protein